MSARLLRSGLLLATALTLFSTAPRLAAAQSDDAQLGSIEKQIRSLQAELHRMKAEAAERDRELRAAQSRAYAPPPTNVAPVMPQIPAGYALVPATPGSTPGSVMLSHVELPKPPPGKPGHIQIGGIDVHLGGFFEAAGYYRSRDEATDLNSNFTSSIPERNSPQYHEPQVGFSARQTRVLADFEAHPDEVTKLYGNVTVDFLGAAPTANYNQSNSWTPRLREAWAEYARSDWGFYFLGGQTWSLATMTQKGVDPTSFNLPLVIDPQYVPGFVWLRDPQFRVAKNLGSNQFWVAASLEMPATVGLGSTGNAAGTAPAITGTTINTSNVGTSVDGNSAYYSDNFFPDLILKSTADFPMFHGELFGIGRAFSDRVSTVGHGDNKTSYGGGVGAGLILHAVPKLLDVQLSGLYGQGTERYGDSQLADATYYTNGRLRPLPGYSALAGVIGHPIKSLDLYAYFGLDHVSGAYDLGLVKGKLATLAGYGSPLVNNISCATELATTPATCSPLNQGSAQITVGDWWRFIQGPYGKMQVGLQYSYTKRYVFPGIGATPKTDENMLFVSFRWYPFS